MAPQSNTVPANVIREMAEYIFTEGSDMIEEDLNLPVNILRALLAAYLTDNNLRIVHR